jgi:hypothetical protein
MKPITLAQRLRILAKASHHLKKAGNHLFRAIGMLRLLADENWNRVDALQEAMSSGGELAALIKDELLKNGACRWCGLTGNVHDARCKRLRNDDAGDGQVLKLFVEMVQRFEQTGELHIQEEDVKLPDVVTKT